MIVVYDKSRQIRGKVVLSLIDTLTKDVFIQKLNQPASRQFPTADLFNSVELQLARTAIETKCCASPIYDLS